MKTSFLQNIKQSLQTEHAKLQEELIRVSPHIPNVTDAFDADYTTLGDKEDESADKAAAIGDNLSLENALTSAIRDVESALIALENGTYGICKYCQQEIDEARLRVRPTSTSCVACKKTLTQEV